MKRKKRMRNKSKKKKQTKAENRINCQYKGSSDKFDFANLENVASLTFAAYIMIHKKE